VAVDRLTGDWFRMWHPIKDIVFMFDYTKLHTISEEVHVIINVKSLSIAKQYSQYSQKNLWHLTSVGIYFHSKYKNTLKMHRLSSNILKSMIFS
jgi:hypothetical protein